MLKVAIIFLCGSVEYSIFMVIGGEGTAHWLRCHSLINFVHRKPRIRGNGLYAFDHRPPNLEEA